LIYRKAFGWEPCGLKASHTHTQVHTHLHSPIGTHRQTRKYTHTHVSPRDKFVTASWIRA